MSESVLYPTDRPIRGLPFNPHVALVVIAQGACEHFTAGPGACLRDGRSPLAAWEADRACDPCIAWAALQETS